MKLIPLLFLSLSVLVQAEPAPRAKPPIMGWSSWNQFRVNIDETMIREQADAMVASGMHKAGYRFINIDDGFFGGRDAQGKLLSHELKFPSGMKALAGYIHGKGLKPGIYSEGGKNTCGSEYDNDIRGIGAGLHGHEEQDLRQMLVEWDYDFIKVDWCGGLRMNLPEQEQYTKISKIIRRLKPGATFNVCRWQYPGDWVKGIADSWRVSADIEPTFESIMKIVDLCEPLWIHSGPGHYNDMDMLQVGRGMSADEDKTHFTLWCMMNSPLLAGNDLRKMSPQTVAILTHPELIALNQDSLAYQARRLRDDGDAELWAKPLGKIDSGEIAVTLLNRAKEPATMSFELEEIGIDAGAGYAVRDLWKRETLTDSTTLADQSFTVPPHGVVVLRVKGKSVAPVFARAADAKAEPVKIPSAAMHRDIPAMVVVPDISRAQPARRFPTLYLLHGAGDDEHAWIDRTPVRELANTYGVIIVTPATGTSWYFDSPVDPASRFETFVAVELVEYIDKHYPTIARRTARALAGNSMGGHGSMFLACRHRDTFSVAAPMSGGMDIRASDPQVGAFPEQWDIKKRLGPIGQNPARWNELAVINVVDTLKNGELAISIDCGDKDFFLTTNRQLHAKLKTMGVAHEYSEHPGAHNWDYWKLALRRQMAFVARHLEHGAVDVR